MGKSRVVPVKARERVMEELHETHPGICRMKSLNESQLIQFGSIVQEYYILFT